MSSATSGHLRADFAWPRTLLAALAVGVAVFLLLMLTTVRHGIAWDEATFRTTALLYQLGELNHDYHRQVDRHPPLVKYLILAGTNLQPFASFLANLRCGQLLATALLAAWFFRTVRRGHSLPVSLLATAALLTVPRVFFHLQVAMADGLLAVFLFMLAERFTASPRLLPRYLWVALLLALALATKYSALLILPALALYILLYARRRAAELAALAAALAVALLLLLAMYLPLWPATWERFGQSWYGAAAHPFERNITYFAGERYGARDTPALYLPVMLAVTTPPLLLLALPACWRFGRPDPLARLTLLLTVTVLAITMVPGVPIYDAERQVVFLFPLFAYCAARAVAGLAVRWQTVALAVLLAGNLVPLAADFPHESSYFNFLIGGRPGAARAGYDISLYADGVNAEAVAWLNDNLPAGAKVLPIPMNPLAFGYWQKYGGLRRDLEFSGAGPFAYRLVQNRCGFLERDELADELDEPEPRFAIRREGVIIVALYRRLDLSGP